MGKVLPDYLSEWTTERVRSEGVTVLPNSRVKSVTKGTKSNLSVKMESGTNVDTDHMVVAVGIEPDQPAQAVQQPHPHVYLKVGINELQS